MSLPEPKTSESTPPGRLAFLETLLLAAVLFAMIALPILEILLRRFFKMGIKACPQILQHLVLVVGVLGGALAAREKRLLSFTGATTFLRGWPALLASLLSATAGITISLWLAVAAGQFVSVERKAGEILAYSIPTWTLQLLLPIGFGVIALRILLTVSSSWWIRLIPLFLSLLLSLLFLHAAEETNLPSPFTSLFQKIPPLDRESFFLPAVVGLLLTTILGLPIFCAIGGAALLCFFTIAEPISSVSIAHYRLVTNPTLPTIPLFTLAGYLLAEGGASQRLIRLFQALFGSFRGGPAIVTVAVCAFFTSFTGASGVTILALAALLMPVLLDAGYEERTSLGLLTGSGSLGMLFPPCLPVILYAVVAKQEIETMFLAGVLPGALLVAMTGIYGVAKAPREASRRKPFCLREAGVAIWECKWELLIPVVALGGIFGGFATPVEASAVTAAYTLFVETVLYRDLRFFRDVPRVMAECGLLVGGVLLILGVALGLTDYLILEMIPDRVVEWVRASIESRYLFLLSLNLLLIVVGCLMDVFSAIIVMAPLLVPLGAAFEIDPVHLGIIFLANLELGYLTPPVGMNLFLSSYRFNRPILEVCRSIVPILLVQLTGVLLITYIPPLTTWLPSLLQNMR